MVLHSHFAARVNRWQADDEGAEHPWGFFGATSVKNITGLSVLVLLSHQANLESYKKGCVTLCVP
jgi:hypothetical protein